MFLIFNLVIIAFVWLIIFCLYFYDTYHTPFINSNFRIGFSVFVILFLFYLNCKT